MRDGCRARARRSRRTSRRSCFGSAHTAWPSRPQHCRKSGKRAALRPPSLVARRSYPPTKCSAFPPGPGARLLVLRTGQLAVRVDRVERMVATAAIKPLPRAFQGSEREWYSGLAVTNGTIVALVNPETLKRVVNRRDEETLDAAWARFKPLQETASS